MPLDRPALTLGADPRSVQQARRWVASVCEELGRQDLLECAELGVSELVTNALLHAGDPISVRVRGTAEHPRVEVSDGSHQPPVLPLSDEPELDDLISTFGRGLKIVAQCSTSWGAAIEPEGKVVWFEPAESPHLDGFPEGALFDLAELGLPPSDELGHELMPVVFEGIPVDTVLALRRHYHDLRREVRLLSLAHEDDYPLAKHLTDVFTSFETAYPADVTEQVLRASAAGLPLVDLAVKVDPARVDVFDRMLTLLDLADEFCRTERLLSLARSEEQVEFQRWFLGEFVRQAAGEGASRWSPAPQADVPAPRSAKIVS